MQQNFIKSFADLRFAIFILIIIALFSITGTVIEQDQTLEHYKINYPSNNILFSWQIIISLGLDHVYKTWWFIFLLILFGTSLLTCTYSQQIPSVKIARKCQFFRTKNQFKKLKLVTTLKNSVLSNLIFELNLKNYSIFQQQHVIYCYKGLIGRIAPIIVHISMILVLSGSVIGSVGGFNAQEIIPKSEIFHVQNLLSLGKFATVPNTSGRVNDFWITYNKNTKIDQFYSDFSILNNSGKEIKRKTISVNHPIKYKGISYYQTDWNLVALRIQDNQLKTTQYPLINIGKETSKSYLSWIPLDEQFKEGLTVLVDNLEGYVSVYDKFGVFQGNLELNESLRSTMPITLVDIISSTGLQIKTDPGIFLIYTGFGFLMVSTIISYVTYSQIWIVEDEKSIFIGGNTNRAKFDFELEFAKLTKKKFG